MRRIGKIQTGKLFSLMGTFNTHACKKDIAYNMQAHNEKDYLTQKMNNLIPETSEGKVRINKGMMYMFKAGILNKINELKGGQKEDRRSQRSLNRKSSKSSDSFGRSSNSSIGSDDASPLRKSRMQKKLKDAFTKKIKNSDSNISLTNVPAKGIFALEKEKSLESKSQSAVTSFPS